MASDSKQTGSDESSARVTTLDMSWLNEPVGSTSAGSGDRGQARKSKRRGRRFTLSPSIGRNSYMSDVDLNDPMNFPNIPAAGTGTPIKMTSVATRDSGITKTSSTQDADLADPTDIACLFAIHGTPEAKPLPPRKVLGPLVNQGAAFGGTGLRSSSGEGASETAMKKDTADNGGPLYRSGRGENTSSCLPSTKPHAAVATDGSATTSAATPCTISPTARADNKMAASTAEQAIRLSDAITGPPAGRKKSRSSRRRSIVLPSEAKALIEVEIDNRTAQAPLSETAATSDTTGAVVTPATVATKVSTSAPKPKTQVGGSEPIRDKANSKSTNGRSKAAEEFPLAEVNATSCLIRPLATQRGWRPADGDQDATSTLVRAYYAAAPGSQRARRAAARLFCFTGFCLTPATPDDARVLCAAAGDSLNWGLGEEKPRLVSRPVRRETKEQKRELAARITPLFGLMEKASKKEKLALEMKTGVVARKASPDGFRYEDRDTGKPVNPAAYQVKYMEHIRAVSAARVQEFALVKTSRRAPTESVHGMSRPAEEARGTPVTGQLPVKPQMPDTGMIDEDAFPTAEGTSLGPKLPALDATTCETEEDAAVGASDQKEQEDRKLKGVPSALASTGNTPPRENAGTLVVGGKTRRKGSEDRVKATLFVAADGPETARCSLRKVGSDARCSASGEFSVSSIGKGECDAASAAVGLMEECTVKSKEDPYRGMEVMSDVGRDPAIMATGFGGASPKVLRPLADGDRESPPSVEIDGSSVTVSSDTQLPANPGRIQLDAYATVDAKTAEDDKARGTSLCRDQSNAISVHGEDMRPLLRDREREERSTLTVMEEVPPSAGLANVVKPLDGLQCNTSDAICTSQDTGKVEFATPTHDEEISTCPSRKIVAVTTTPSSAKESGEDNEAFRERLDISPLAFPVAPGYATNIGDEGQLTMEAMSAGGMPEPGKSSQATPAQTVSSSRADETRGFAPESFRTPGRTPEEEEELTAAWECLCRKIDAALEEHHVEVARVRERYTGGHASEKAMSASTGHGGRSVASSSTTLLNATLETTTPIIMNSGNEQDGAEPIAAVSAGSRRSDCVPGVVSPAETTDLILTRRSSPGVLSHSEEEAPGGASSTTSTALSDAEESLSAMAVVETASGAHGSPRPCTPAGQDGDAAALTPSSPLLPLLDLRLSEEEEEEEEEVDLFMVSTWSASSQVRIEAASGSAAARNDGTRRPRRRSLAQTFSSNQSEKTAPQRLLARDLGIRGAGSRKGTNKAGGIVDDGNGESAEGSLCGLCCKERCDTMLQPCGHSICGVCEGKLRAQAERSGEALFCPWDRQLIDEVARM